MTAIPDSSGNSNTATAVGAVTFGELSLTGDCGTSVELWGGYITIDSTVSALNASGVVSFLAFIKFDVEPTTYQDVLNIVDPDDNRQIWIRWAKATNSYYASWGPTGSNSVIAEWTNTTVPHMLYVEYNFTEDKMIIDINAGEVRQTASTVGLPSTSALGVSGVIGAGTIPAVDAATNFKGWLDEVAFFNRALSTVELGEIFNVCGVILV